MPRDLLQPEFASSPIEHNVLLGGCSLLPSAPFPFCRFVFLPFLHSLTPMPRWLSRPSLRNPTTYLRPLCLQKSQQLQQPTPFPFLRRAHPTVVRFRHFVGGLIKIMGPFGVCTIVYSL